MIAPDVLPLETHVLRHRRRDIASRRASVRAIEPAIGSPAETARDRVRILEAESAQRHLRIAIRNSVVVRIGIEKEIRRVHHPDAARARDRSRGDIQPFEHHRVLVEKTGALRVLEHDHLVRALRTAWRRLRHLVEHRAQMLIVAHDFQPRWKLVLPVKHHPKPPARIPAHVERLLHLGLAGHEIDRESLPHLESFQRVLWRCRRRVVAQDSAARIRLHHLADFLVARGRSGLICMEWRAGGAREKNQENTAEHGRTHGGKFRTSRALFS